MNAPKIPYENEDLIAAVRKNDRRFLCKWLCMTIAVLLFEVLFLFRTAAAYIGGIQAVLLCIVLFVLPFFTCGGVARLVDQGFAGTVLTTRFSVRLEAFSRIGGGIGRGGRPYASTRGYNQVNYCKMVIRTDKDTLKTRTVRLPGDSETFPIREGDRVVKYRGLPYPVVVGCKTPVCVACGYMDDDGKGECRGCGCSLVVLTEDDVNRLIGDR